MCLHTQVCYCVVLYFCLRESTHATGRLFSVYIALYMPLILSNIGNNVRLDKLVLRHINTNAFVTVWITLFTYSSYDIDLLEYRELIVTSKGKRVWTRYISRTGPPYSNFCII